MEVGVINRGLRLITPTETLIILDITKTESNNCFTTHCFQENNEKTHYRTEHSLFSTSDLLTSLSVNLTLLLEIMHCARNL